MTTGTMPCLIRCHTTKAVPAGIVVRGALLSGGDTLAFNGLNNLTLTWILCR